MSADHGKKTPEGLLKNAFKSYLKAILRVGGLELRRLAKSNGSRNRLQPLHKDFLNALHDSKDGRPSSFLCPLEKVVDYAGFGFGGGRWHPFSHVVRVWRDQGDAEAESALKAFYERHQPRNASEALLGFGSAPPIFSDLRPHVHYLTPWTAKTPEEVGRDVENFTTLDNAEHGAPTLDLENDGFQLFGPVSKAKRSLELTRLCSIAESIIAHGYNRSFGDAKFCVIKRGEDYRFVARGGGYHRTAVMSALGYDTIPGRFYPGPFIFDGADVEYWPQVRRGVWSKPQALAYLDYLFDYNSYEWYTTNLKN